MGEVPAGGWWRALLSPRACIVLAAKSPDSDTLPAWLAFFFFWLLCKHTSDEFL